MRLLMITPSFPEAPGRATGGVSTATAGLVEGLIRVREELRIDVLHAGVAVPRSTDWSGWGELPRVRVRRLRIEGPLSRLSLPAVVRQPVHAVAEQVQPDVIHVQGAAGLYAPSRVPSVFTVHGIPGKDAAFRGRFGVARSALATLRDTRPLRHYPHLIAIAGHVVQQLDEHVRGRWHFIPNAIHPDFFEVGADPGQAPPVVVQIGSLGRRKNPLATIEAVGLLVQRGVEVQLRLAGPRIDAEYGAQLDAAVERLDLHDRVHFLGSLDRDAVFDELRGARIVALPSLQETAPMVIAEAAAAGVASVVAPAGGAAEMLLDGISGRLCDPGSPESLADALQAPVRDPELARTWGQRMHAGASRYHPDTVAEATARVYESIR